MNCSHRIAILHGWGAGPELLTGLKTQLESLGHCVFLYEMPGYGSRRDERACESLAELAADASERLPDYDIWIGWSLGAMVALKVAAQAPDFLSALLAVVQQHDLSATKPSEMHCKHCGKPFKRTLIKRYSGFSDPCPQPNIDVQLAGNWHPRPRQKNRSFAASTS